MSRSRRAWRWTGCWTGGQRLRYDCRVDPSVGFFVDQRWFDLAPGFLSDFAIVREPEYNVAYWNVHSRRLEREGDRYLVDGRQLAFFHFSGFDPARPPSLSLHQDRIDVTRHAVLEWLLAEYAADVQAQGHAKSRQWPYSYRALADGTRIDESIRAAYADFADDQHRRGVQSMSPFTLEGTTAFKNWLGEQAPGAPPGVTRVLERSTATAPTLPSPTPISTTAVPIHSCAGRRQYGQRRYRCWRGDGRHVTMSRTARASPSVLSRTSVDEVPFALRGSPWGVNVIGCANAAVETEAAARLILRALDLGEIPALPIAALATGAPGPKPSGPTWSDARFPVNVITMEPDTMFDARSSVRR